MKYSERRGFSVKKLERLKSELNLQDDLQNLEDLCIYATGSYARLEACHNSDLDIFFISENKFPKIKKTLIDASLIKLTREMGICEFSGDGRYLEIHEIGKMTKELGGQSDDYENFFTARLLLLLESYPLCNEALYESFVNEVIKSYFKDFEDHESDFKPIFLINDIVRYWKTITLNYENNRINNGDRTGKMQVKNFKLKFSRKLMCFSFIIKLLSLRDSVTKPKVFSIVNMTPIQRLESLEIKDSEELIKELINLYDWFLYHTSGSKDQIITWISSKKNKSEVLAKSNEFGDKLFEILLKSDRKKLLKYLVI